MPTTGVNVLPRDGAGRYFMGPWDEAANTGTVWRGANVSGDYADGRVVLYDASGQPLLTSVSHGAPDTGNPLKIGGKAETTAPAAVDDGDRVDAWFDARGRLVVGLRDDSGNLVGLQTVAADGASATANLLRVASREQMQNGSGTYDSVRNNASGTLLASAARTSSTSPASQVNYNARGVVLTLTITATPNNAETLTMRVYFRDQESVTNYATVTAFTAIVASSIGAAPVGLTFIYIVYPGAVETVASGAEVQGIPVPRHWTPSVVHSGAGSWTYSLGYSYVL